MHFRIDWDNYPHDNTNVIYLSPNPIYLIDVLRPAVISRRCLHSYNQSRTLTWSNSPHPFATFNVLMSSNVCNLGIWIGALAYGKAHWLNNAHDHMTSGGINWKLFWMNMFIISLDNQFIGEYSLGFMQSQGLSPFWVRAVWYHI